MTPNLYLSVVLTEDGVYEVASFIALNSAKMKATDIGTRMRQRAVNSS